jgi:hypothetical protein
MKMLNKLLPLFILGLLTISCGGENQTNNSSTRVDEVKKTGSVSGMYEYEDNETTITVNISGDAYSSTVKINGRTFSTGSGAVIGRGLYDESGNIKIGDIREGFIRMSFASHGQIRLNKRD